MKIFNKLYGLSLFSLFLSVVACTTETEEPFKKPTPEPSGGEARREVLLTLKNKLSLADKKADTKADVPIATAAENKISSLDIYVFGSSTEDGTYTYQERLCYRENNDDLPVGEDVTSFDLTVKDAEAKETTALLSLKKGLFVKLYCIANQSDLVTTDGNPVTNFQALDQSNPGQKDNTVTPGAPKEADFLTYHSPLIDPASTTDILVAPLPMTGSYTTPLDLTDFSVSARLQLGFKLTRAVARFDIVNDATISKFTIQSVSMAKGRKGISFFPLKVIGTLPEAATGDLITYPARKFEGENTNTGTTVSAFYSYPSPEKDDGCLILSGTYATNKSENIPVAYKVPFKPTDGGNYIEVSQNHRYTVNITAADEYHLDFTLDVADWTDEGSIDDYEPEGDPDVIGLKVRVDGVTVTYDEASRTITMPIIDNPEFTIEGYSASGYLTRKYYEDGDTDHDWLEMTPAPDLTKASTAPIVYTIKLKDGYAGNKYPVAFIRFTDKIIARETVVIIQPISNPVMKLNSITAGGIFDADNSLITLYKNSSVVSPSVSFCVFASSGSKLAFPDADTPGDWLTVTPAGLESDAVQSDYTMTLNAEANGFPDPFPTDGKTFTLANKDNAAKTETVTLKLKSDLAVTTSTEGQGKYDAGGNLLTLYDQASDKVKLIVNTICGSEIIGVPDWLNVSKENEGKNETTYTFHVADDGSTNVNGSFTIRSKADNSIAKQYNVESKSSAVTVTPKNQSSGSSISGKTITLYQRTSVTNPRIVLGVSASGGSQLEFDGGKPGWLTISPSSLESDLSQADYTVTLNSSSSDFPNPFPAEGLTFTVKNKGNVSKTEKVTLKLKSDLTISPATYGQAEFNSSSSVLNLYNNSSDQVRLTVNTIGGSEVVNVPSWLTVSKTNDGKNQTAYTFYVTSGASTGVNTNITIRSKADNSILKTYRVNSISTAVTFSSATKSNNYTTISNFSSSNPTIDYFACSGSYIDFTVTSPKGVTGTDGWTAVKIMSESTLATGQKQTNIRLQTTQNDNWHSTATSNCTLTITDNYSNSVKKTLTVRQYRVVYEGSKVPPNEISNNGINWWVAPVNENNGNVMSYSTFESRKSSICPSGWKIPSSNEYRQLTNNTGDICFRSYTSVGFSKSAFLAVFPIVGSAPYYSNDSQTGSYRKGLLSFHIVDGKEGVYVDGLAATSLYVRCVKNK